MGDFKVAHFSGFINTTKFVEHLMLNLYLEKMKCLYILKGLGEEWILGCAEWPIAPLPRNKNETPYMTNIIVAQRFLK